MHCFVAYDLEEQHLSQPADFDILLIAPVSARFSKIGEPKHTPNSASVRTINVINEINWRMQRCKLHTSRKHAYIILTPLNPTFI